MNARANGWSAMWRARWGAAMERVPGYRPGLTLMRALHEMRDFFIARGAPQNTSVALEPSPGLSTCLLRERVERHFLMHVVTLEFEFHVPTSSVGVGQLRLFPKGWRGRNGVEVRIRGPRDVVTTELAQRLCGDRQVASAIGVLAFRRCEILPRSDGWCVRIEPYGGSEVVGRAPAFRRYIRLGAEQVKALHVAARALTRSVAGPGEFDEFAGQAIPEAITVAHSTKVLQ